MSETSPPTSTPNLETLITQLSSQEAKTRRRAAETAAELTVTSVQVLSKLELLAANDQSKTVREAALKALLSPVHRDLQRNQVTTQQYIRQVMVHHIEHWHKTGLINVFLAETLKQKYNWDLTLGDVKSKEAAEKVFTSPTEKRSLREILLSEAAIKTILYLGAFLIIVAAFIFATVLETLRVPILILLSLGFLAAAVILKKRLPQASFVLYIVFSLLVPISSGVIAESINLSSKAVQPYWIVVVLLLLVCWGAATWFYESRLFHLLACGATTSLALQIGFWVDSQPILFFLLVQIGLVLQIASTVFLANWQNNKFTLWVFLFQTVEMGIALILSWITVLDSFNPTWWLAFALGWFLACVFWIIGNRTYHWRILPYLAVFTLLPIPWFFSEAFEPSTQAVLMIEWTWTTGLLMASEWLNNRKEGEFQEYKPALQWTSFPMYALIGLISFSDTIFSVPDVEVLNRIEIMGFVLMFITGLIYLGLTFNEPRQRFYGGALLALFFAYLMCYRFPIIAKLEVFPGFVLLWPATFFVLLEIITKRGFNTGPFWHSWPRYLGAVMAGLASSAMVILGYDEPLRASMGFFFLGVLALVYADSMHRLKIAYFGTSGLAISLLFLLHGVELSTKLYPFLGLAGLYYLVSFTPALRNRTWQQILRYSGLGLGLITALASPLFGETEGIITAALMATVFAFESFQRKNVWWALPANLLYMLAYFMLLSELKIEEPQFFSVGAALLGIVMHYLLNRSESKIGTFVAGMLSQLILLSTSYIQMIILEETQFFFVLFFQALAVVAYGLVIRSRSLVFTPVGFIVLSTLTVMFSALSGLATLIVIGCTGLLLLGAGIMALLMRERLLAARQKISEQLKDWKA